MADWYLAFQHPESLSLQTCEQVMATFVGAPVAMEVGELDGNPRDCYSRPITITGQRGEVRVVLTTNQAMRDRDDPEPHILDVNVRLSSETAAFATKLSAWRAMSEAFTKLGCLEHTLALRASPIVDDADAAGETVTAARLRVEIAAALIDQARRCASVFVASPRVDVEPILAAFPDPAGRVTFSLSDCGLQALPANFALFPNLETLSLEEDAFDGSVLRGVSRPKLKWLTLRGKGLRRVTKEDLAGFPNLEVLQLWKSPLEELDPGILEVCPKLTRIYVEDTPLWKDEPKMAELRARWPRMWCEPPRPFAIEPPEPEAAPTVVRNEIDPTLRPFFDAILAAPDDEDPRLALAKILTERGDPRGEQIRLACELAKLEYDDPAFQPLAVRCAVLPQFRFFSEIRYPFVTQERLRRGFIEAIQCSIPDFVKHAEQLMRDGPILGYLVNDSGGQGALLAECPALAKLRSLDLRWLGGEDRAAILASPHLANTLQELTLSPMLESAAAVTQLAEQLSGLTRLRRLKLTGTLAAAAVESLVELVEARGLEQLHLKFCSLKPTSLIETLWDKLGDRVRPRRALRVPFKDGVLVLSSPLYSLEQMRTLFATGDYRSAVKIGLGLNTFGDDVLELIATSRAFPALVELNAGGITDAGVRALATKAVGLDALARIDLGHAPGGRAKGGVSDEAVEALARSPRLPALTSISRFLQHHCYASDARDDNETIEIRRDDGHIVKSVIGHFLWP